MKLLGLTVVNLLREEMKQTVNGNIVNCLSSPVVFHLLSALGF